MLLCRAGFQDMSLLNRILIWFTLFTVLGKDLLSLLTDGCAVFKTRHMQKSSVAAPAGRAKLPCLAFIRLEVLGFRVLPYHSYRDCLAHYEAAAPLHALFLH